MQEIIQNPIDTLGIYNAIVSSMGVLLMFVLGIIVYWQNFKLNKLQAELDLSNQHKFSLENEKRKALLDYYDIMVVFVDFTYSMLIWNFMEKVDKFWEYDAIYHTKSKRVELFIKSSWFEKDSLGLKEQTHNLKKIVGKYFNELDKNSSTDALFGFGLKDPERKKLDVQCNKEMSKQYDRLLISQMKMRDSILTELKSILNQ